MDKKKLLGKGILLGQLEFMLCRKKSEVSVKPENYNPAKSKYHPVDDACWNVGQKYVRVFTMYLKCLIQHLKVFTNWFLKLV